MRESSNPPAFPVDCNTNPDCDAAGMTLLDYFAAHAPITMSEALESLPKGEVSHADIFKRISQMRFAYAEAMLKARAE